MSTALIVGTSRGLGRGLVDEHLSRGWTVIGTVQRRTDAEAGTPGLTTEILEMTDGDGIDALRERIPGPVDRLFVNGGITGPTEPIGDADPDRFAETMLVNTLAPLRIVDRLADLVSDTGTVAVMSSRQASIELNDDATKEAYRISKAGLNMGLRSIAVRRADSRTYLAVNPGWVRTEMGTGAAYLSVDESVRDVVDVLDAHGGRGGVAFVDHSGEPLPW